MVLHNVTRCDMMLQGVVTGCYTVLQGVTWCYIMLQGVTWRYMVLQGGTWVLHGVT